MASTTSKRLQRRRTQMILVLSALALVLALPRILWGANATESTTVGTITVLTSGITTKDGTIRAALYNENNYLSLDNVVRGNIEKPVTGSLMLIFNGIPYGTYAIALYHDQNNNNKLDKSAIGIPKEPYGFSNNAKPVLSAPTFKKTAFRHSTPTTHLKITLQ